MNILGLSHCAIAVPDLQKALSFYRDTLGFTLHHIEEVPAEGMRAAMLEREGVTLEVMEPTRPESPVGRFVERRGGGLHHLTFRVEDLDAAVAECKAKGCQFVEPAPRPGAPSAGGARIAFLHPRSTGGVLVELAE